MGSYLVLAMGAGLQSVSGNLVLQEPASEYHYSRETGRVVELAIKVGSEVAKKKVMLEYVSEDSKKTKTLISNENGYVDYVNPNAVPGKVFAPGELLLRVQSNRVFGAHYFEQKEIESMEFALEIQAKGRLWLCSDARPIEVRVDDIAKNSLLVSMKLKKEEYSQLQHTITEGSIALHQSMQACL
ncbi:hypothetical protein CWC22_004615 [Pseudoalteromonas rubra]|uniref:Uncharacterized protein n=1 Tax=Pseudoalteromonas rubra TaxID=43658 RepID=A0A5S3USC4_9GAMM|nr:hypothetical protein [Pseudoalteromonas rubra]QPB82302.1 hypothetical protein CWC22_004615 [Pseudoalteromonas rubra]